MERVTPRNGAHPGKHGLAVGLANGIGVVGLWACPEDKGRSYASEVNTTIDAYKDLLTSQPCLLAGDFNLSPDGQADRRAGVTRRLRELGYVSAYHAFNAIDFGDEQPTYYHQFKRDRPFHIDMIFLPEHLVPNIRSVDIAAYDGWVEAGSLRSDHVPVTIELELEHEIESVKVD
jgi:endonuclease/exonuclease/phosphatase family metal-dependent hydrolase